MPALLVDFDGTLADSLAAMRLAFHNFIAAHGGDPQDFSFARFNGPPLIEIVRTLKAELSLTGEVSALMADYEAGIDRVYAEVRPSAGAADLLASAKRRQWLVAVVTSNSRERLNSWLKQHKLNDLCDLLVCGEDVTRGKPWPDPYLAALRQGSVAAGDAIAVEDSAQGAHAALAAGIATYGYQPADRPKQDWPAGVTEIEAFAMLESRLFGHE